MEMNGVNIKAEENHVGKTPATKQAKKVTLEGGNKLKRNATHYGKSSVISSDLPPTNVSTDAVPREYR